MKITAVTIDHVATDEAESITAVVLDVELEDGTHRACDVVLPVARLLRPPAPLDPDQPAPEGP